MQRDTLTEKQSAQGYTYIEAKSGGIHFERIRMQRDTLTKDQSAEGKT